MCVCAGSWPINIRRVMLLPVQRRNRGPPQAPREGVSFPEGRETHNGGRCQRAIVALGRWVAGDRDSPEIDERGRKFEILICAFGLEVINEVHQGPTLETRKGSSFIDVTHQDSVSSNKPTHRHMEGEARMYDK